MRVLALTFGSEGDTRPMVALCRGLRDAGHDAVLLAERAGSSYAHALDVPFVPLAGDMAAELRGAASGLTRRGVDVHSVARTLAAIARANTTQWMRATLEHARNADVVICAGLAIYVGLSCAEALGVRAIGAGLQPMTPTRAFASPSCRDDRASWRLGNDAYCIARRRAVDRPAVRRRSVLLGRSASKPSASHPRCSRTESSRSRACASGSIAHEMRACAIVRGPLDN